MHIQGGVLKRKVLEPHTELTLAQIVVPETKTRELWEKYHNTSGHMGTAKMEALLRRSFYWPGMTTNIQEWTSKCASCVQQKKGPEVRAPLAPIVTSYPLETVAIDYLSLGRHGDTYPYLLVMAVPTKDQTAATTTRVLWRHLIQPWGCPERILSDQGAAFESSLVAQLCSLYGCTKVQTTPYRPQGNGACERFNKTLLSLLAALSEADQVQWPDHLPTLLQMYNNTVHNTTGLTPHFVMFGRHARLPVETAVRAPQSTQRHDLEGWVHKHNQMLQKVFKQVAAKTKESRMRDKERYDLKAKHLPLLPGERVLLRNFRRREHGKLAPHWQPQPYVVLKQLRPGLPVFQIKPEGQEGPIRAIHQNHLRSCPFNPPEVHLQDPHAKTNQPNRVAHPSPSFVPLTFVPTASVPSAGPEGNEVVAPVVAPPVGRTLSDETLPRRSQRMNRGRPPDRYGY